MCNVACRPTMLSSVLLNCAIYPQEKHKLCYCGILFCSVTALIVICSVRSSHKEFSHNLLFVTVRNLIYSYSFEISSIFHEFWRETVLFLSWVKFLRYITTEVRKILNFSPAAQHVSDTHDDTPQNFASRKGGTKLHMAINMYLHINPRPVRIQAYENKT
jgi:hypothetical protein